MAASTPPIFRQALTDSTGSGNYGFYAVVDQKLWQPERVVAEIPSGKSKQTLNAAPGEEPDVGVGWFARAGMAPADRNFVSFYFDTGLAWQGPWPGREADALGLAFGCARLSNGAREDLREEGGNPVGASMVLEATYAAQLTPGLTVQPDLQYIIQPDAEAGSANAFVIGGRVAIAF